MSDYWTMKEIGNLFGITSHAVGRALKQSGYRTFNGKPSAEAFGSGMVQQKWTDDYCNYLWAWNVQKTVPLLEQAGFERKAPMPEEMCGTRYSENE